MPKTFDEDFEDGDLIYGLNGARVGYIQRLGTGRYGNVLIIDDLSNQFLGTGLKIPTNVREQRLGTGGIGDAYAPDAVTSGAALGFIEFMENHPKWNPDLRPGEDRFHTRTKHGSKAGLEYTTKVMKRKIHFVLDKLDMQMVVGKSGPGDEEGENDVKLAIMQRKDPAQAEKKRDVTGSELRWLYRHRNDTAVMDNVRFWEDYNPVAPPWNDQRCSNLWATYKPKSEQLPSTSSSSRLTSSLTSTSTSNSNLPLTTSNSSVAVPGAQSISGASSSLSVVGSPSPPCS